jgi:phospholipid/cholesterol/gamma-HCH transport system substrate-binding protein
MQRSSNDFWVGLFVLIGAAALLFLSLQSANLLTLNFQSNYRVTAKFDNIGGIKPKAPVKSSGVVVGRVESIAFDDKSFQAFVTLSMDNRYAFPQDSSLKILTAGLLGEQYIGIEAGAADKNLAAGDTISTTQSAVVLENLISQFLFSKAADGKEPSAKDPAKEPSNGLPTDAPKDPPKETSKAAATESQGNEPKK